MSRTYHHGDRAKRRRFPDFHYSGMPPAEPTPPKRKRVSAPWRWMSTPGSWNYIMHTRPWRRRIDAMIRRELAYGWPWCAERHAYVHARSPGAYRRPHVYYY